MNEWTRTDILGLIGLVVAIVSCVAAVLAIPNLRRLVGLIGKDLLIFAPKNKEAIPILWGEHKPIVRPISGEVTGFSGREIEKLGLFVDILIKTDHWYPQGSARVESDGKWMLKEARFGGSVHIIKAVLKDHYSREHKSVEIELNVS
jgi:hypothetical protein